jgi:hypothetical protein
MSHRRLRVAAATILVLAAAAAPAHADYTVSGKFSYRDRPFGTAGFTGANADLPIRFADVEVYDTGTSAVLGSGATNATGGFSFSVTDASTRNIAVRVKTTSVNTPTLKIRVLQTATISAFAVATAPFASHAPSTNIDFTATPVVALPGTGGDPFNIFDNTLDAMDFLATLRGSRPTILLTLYWATNSNDGTFYSNGDHSIHLLGLGTDSDGYDDTVIQHEIGHYTEFTLANSDNPGGSHGLNGTYPLTLTWSEGWATFFENMVRRWKGFARPEIYVDTSGQAGAGHALISYELETPSLGVLGANNEVSVNAALWDLVDDTTTADATPGVDDDPLRLPNGPLEFWQTFTTYFPTATSISMEDFWDGWFAGGHGHLADMQTTFAGHGIEYFADAFEPDDSPGQARTVVAGSAAVHHTIYPAGDVDWFIIGVQGGAAYSFATQSLLSGAQTHLDLYVNNGATLIASSGDDNPISTLGYTPAQSSVVWVRCRRYNSTDTYGSYDFVVTGPPVAVEVSDVNIAAVGPALRVTWRAQRDGTFSHFEVERSASETGPWTVLGTAADPGDANAPFAFVDAAVEAGRLYEYRVIGVEADGNRQAFGPFAATAPAPARLALAPPQPNPFNPTTVLRFEVPRPGRVWLQIFTAAGTHVRTLVGGESMGAGSYMRTWDGRDAGGRPVASGVYWVRIASGAVHDSRRAVLVR